MNETEMLVKLQLEPAGVHNELLGDHTCLFLYSRVMLLALFNNSTGRALGAQKTQNVQTA